MYQPNDLHSFWMPFTANRAFKQNPRMLVAAKDMHYTTIDNRQVIDGSAGMWCCNAGHNRGPIVKAIQDQAATLDYSPPFQMAHPKAFEFANRIAELTPEGLNQVFFTNSGSESVDTALKIALAYHQVTGNATRTRLIGRERGYHGVGFGGTSVGGIGPNRKSFGAGLGGIDHLSHTHDLAKNSFTKGLPEHGVELADELESIVALHDASTIAAVIVEPVACAGGVLPPPKGYLQRLREICTKHGILLIFDEVITGFGRVGSAFASQEFDVTPDIIASAKALTSGTVPMGAVIVRDEIYDAFMQGPPNMIELFHGYTYSAHPLACAAGLATLDVYRDENLFERAKETAPYWQEKIHSLRSANHVIDIRNYGLVGAIELSPREGAPTARAFESFIKAYELGALIRITGDTIALSPPLIIENSHIDTLVNIIGEAINSVD